MVIALRAFRLASVLVLVLGGGCTVVTSVPGSGFSTTDGAADGSAGGSSGGSSSSSSGGFGGGDASSCQPGNVATFHADAYHPATGAGQGACLADSSGDPVAEFYVDCLGPNATTENCNSFRTQYATCVACILTPETAPKYGPLIDHGGFVTANVAGCIELAGDQQTDASELTCATAVQALAGCELAACEANCAVHDAASLADYEQCASSAEEGGCATYATAADCAQAEQDASTLGAACLGDFQTFYQTVAAYFCGPPQVNDAGPAPPQPDAGSAGNDASGD